MRDLTIVEIAKKLNVSTATVSRALNESSKVKESTRKRILDFTQNMGYSINGIASNLRSNKSKIIGLIVPKISMNFHSEVITTIQNELYGFGYNVIILQSNDSVALEKQAAETLSSLRVAGVIAAVTLHTTDFSHFNIFLQRHIPLIFYDRIPDYSFDSTNISGDDFQGGFNATKHLMEVGCSNILHISGPLECYVYKYRSKGYKSALEKSGFLFKPENIYYHELTYENAWDTLSSAFDRDPSIDGIFAANDTCALAALDFCFSKGLKVPADVKIIGYSNDKRTSISNPSLSSVEQYPGEFGKKTVEVLMNQLSNETNEIIDKNIKLNNYVIPTTIIKRMSTYR